VDINKLTTADRVVCGSAIVFLIATFLPWYGIDGVGDNTGWDYFLTGILPLLIAIVMVAQIAVTRFTTTPLPTIPLSWGQVHLIGGAIVGVLLLLRTAIVSEVDTFAGDFELDRQYGLFVALIAALALAAGGFLKSKEPESAQAGPGGPGYPPPPPGSGYPQQF
jgi:hypothetical protein